MSIGEQDVGGSSSAGTGGSGSAGTQAGGVSERASAAKDETAKVASSAAGSAKDVASEAASQASDVMAEARTQISSLMDDTKRELNTQLESRGTQAASGLRTLSGQLQALAEGRSESTGPLGNYVRDAERRVHTLAQRLDDEGPQGVLQDVTAFARRRPGAFLFGAAVAGFAVGRMVRAGAAAAHDNNGNGSAGTQLPPQAGVQPATSGLTAAAAFEEPYAAPASGLPRP